MATDTSIRRPRLLTRKRQFVSLWAGSIAGFLAATYMVAHTVAFAGPVYTSTESILFTASAMLALTLLGIAYATASKLDAMEVSG